MCISALGKDVFKDETVYPSSRGNSSEFVILVVHPEVLVELY